MKTFSREMKLSKRRDPNALFSLQRKAGPHKESKRRLRKRKFNNKNKEEEDEVF